MQREIPVHFTFRTRPIGLKNGKFKELKGTKIGNNIIVVFAKHQNSYNVVWCVARICRTFGGVVCLVKIFTLATPVELWM